MCLHVCRRVMSCARLIWFHLNSSYLIPWRHSFKWHEMIKLCNQLAVKKLIFDYSNRQTQYRHLPPLPRKVFFTQLATRLPVGAGCCWGVGCRGPVTPFVSHIPRGLPATGRGPIGSRPATIRVCVQEMPHQVLQVPQHPDKVPAEGQPPATREREHFEPVSLITTLKMHEL